MHDVNIEDMTEAKLSILALSLFSSTDIKPIKYGRQWCMMSILKTWQRQNCRF